MRGQANLPTLAIALLVVTSVAGLSLTLADGAFASADRDAADRATARAITDRLVSEDSPVTERRNVLDGRRIDRQNVGAVVPRESNVRVSVGDDVVYEQGDPTGGQTVRRLALVAERQVVTLRPPLVYESVTLPRRSPNVTITIDDSATVRTVRANSRVVLHDPGGIEGANDVALSRYETTTLRLDGENIAGAVTITYYPRQVRKVLVEVTVDG